jgi:hypothetical protein
LKEAMNRVSLRRQRSCVWSVTLCALAASTGCRRSDTVSVTGQITLDGTALPTGTIVFTPIEKTAGPSVGCEIVDGRYSISADRGPLRGAKYRVEIRSIDPASGSTKDPRSGGVYPVFRDRVPTAYNAASQLMLAVPDEAANVQQDFDLDSRARQ